MNPHRHPVLHALFGPLSLAAYVAWAVVWLTTLDGIAQRFPDWLWSARLALLAFLAAFVVLLAAPRAERPLPFALLTTLMGGCALLLVALRPNTTAPILLVLLAAVLASRLQTWLLTAALAAINLVCICIYRIVWDSAWNDALVSVLAFSSFQVFAALVMRSAKRAEDMAEQLRATNAELLTTRSLLAESARDGERLRLSRELHDVAGHGLTALKLNLAALVRDPRRPDPERVGLCAQLADELLQNLRSVVRQMRNAPGLDLGLALQRLGLPYPRPRLQLQIDEGLQIDRRDAVEAVLRAVQEALTNAARHGSADTLRVVLRQQGSNYRLDIEDDGRALATLRPGGGLSGMRERFELLGGEFKAAPGPRGGVHLSARWPVEQPA